MNYCTLFDSNYLSRGLALYNSLVKFAPQNHLYIFAFDDNVYQILATLNLAHATVISLREFETPELLRVKPTRNAGEYCWTCTPSIILHCLQNLGLKEVCYLDADLFFWRDPQELLNEMQHSSILLTEHRYSAEYDHSAVSGKYCVQFMYFKNDSFGLEALKWWEQACQEWCYNRIEDGKFGDQKYLDDWLVRFRQVHVLQHLGGGVAPWNVQQYQLADKQNAVMCEKHSGLKFNLIFYHFHGLKFINQRVDFGHYRLSREIIDTIYFPYVQHLLLVEEHLKQNPQIKTLLTKTNLHGKSSQPLSIKKFLRAGKMRINGIYNVFSIAQFNAEQSTLLTYEKR